MSIVTDLLPVYDELLGLLDDAGLCPYLVSIRVRTWSGERVGLGTSADVLTPIVLLNGKRPLVKLVQEKDVVAPGSPIQKAKFEVGPLAQAYVGGGLPATTLHPAPNKAVEVHYVVQDTRPVPNIPAAGLLCKKTSEDLSDPMSVKFTIESLGIVST